MKSFAVLGGDLRSRYLAQALKENGYTVYCCGLGSFEDLAAADITTACKSCDAAVFPIAATRDGKTLFAPLCPLEHKLTDELAAALFGKRVYCGNAKLLGAVSQAYSQLELVDYGKDEVYLEKNAELSAEAALMLAIKNSQLGLCEASCLVTGFGRIGAHICRMLSNMGTNVYCSDIVEEKMEAAAKLGYGCVNAGELQYTAPLCDIFINTCISPVLDSSVISLMRSDAIVIDVASEPHGCNFESCEERGIFAIKANNLPGRYSPKTAGRIIKDTVLKLEEEKM